MFGQKKNQVQQERDEESSSSEDERKEPTQTPGSLSPRVEAQGNTELNETLVKLLKSKDRDARIAYIKQNLTRKLAAEFYQEHMELRDVKDEWVGELQAHFGPGEDSESEYETSESSESESSESEKDSPAEVKKKTKKSESKSEDEGAQKLAALNVDKPEPAQERLITFLLPYDEEEQAKVMSKNGVVSAEYVKPNPNMSDSHVWKVMYRGKDPRADVPEAHAVLSRQFGYNDLGQVYSKGTTVADDKLSDGSRVQTKTDVECKHPDQEREKKDGFSIECTGKDQAAINKTHFVQVLWCEVISNDSGGKAHYRKDPIRHPKLKLLPAADGTPGPQNYVLDADGYYDEKAHQFRVPESVLMYDAPSDLGMFDLHEAFEAAKDVESVDYRVHFTTYLVRDQKPLYRVNVDMARHYPKGQYKSEAKYTVGVCGEVAEVDKAHGPAWELCMKNEKQ